MGRVQTFIIKIVRVAHPSKADPRYFMPVTFLLVALSMSSSVTGQVTDNSPPYDFKKLHAVTEVSIAAVGDLMLGSHVIPIVESEGVTYPFQRTGHYLKSADIAIANLEAPFTTRGEPFEKKFTFKVPPEFSTGLKLGGIDVVNIANNHIMDFGEDGLISTMITLDTVGVKYSGAGMNLDYAEKPAIINVADKTVAFLGYSMTFPTEFYAKKDSSGTAYPDPERLRSVLNYWRDKVDFIVTSFHWSAEKLETPKQYQIDFAHLAIDSGADLVLGHHPHLLQGLEIYKNRLIAYSLGNFSFGSYSGSAVDSIILKVYLCESGLYSAHCIPINVDNRKVEFQPRIMNGERRDKVIAKLKRLSRPLNGGKDILSDSGLILGEWSNFYDTWLFETAVGSYWKSQQPLPASDTMQADSTTTSGLRVR